MREVKWEIVDRNDKYEISTDGRIRNRATDRELKTSIRGGYLSIKLYGDGHHLIHRLVAEAFLLRDNDKQIVDHIDRNKLNNDVSNLRWINRSDNFINSDRGDKASLVTRVKYCGDIGKWKVHQPMGKTTICNSIDDVCEVMKMVYKNVKSN